MPIEYWQSVEKSLIIRSFVHDDQMENGKIGPLMKQNDSCLGVPPPVADWLARRWPEHGLSDR